MNCLVLVHAIPFVPACALCRRDPTTLTSHESRPVSVVTVDDSTDIKLCFSLCVLIGGKISASHLVEMLLGQSLSQAYSPTRCQIFSLGRCKHEHGNLQPVSILQLKLSLPQSIPKVSYIGQGFTETSYRWHFLTASAWHFLGTVGGAKIME